MQYNKQIFQYMQSASVHADWFEMEEYDLIIIVASHGENQKHILRSCRKHVIKTGRNAEKVKRSGRLSWCHNTRRGERFKVL